MRTAGHVALACALALLLPHAFCAAARAQQQPDPAAAGVTQPPGINVLPFISLAETGRKLVEEGRLGAGTTFDITATAELEKDGSLKPESVVVEWKTAAPNEDLNRLALQSVAAVSQTRILGMLTGHAKAVRLNARLDAQNVALGFEADLNSADEASKWALGYDAVMMIGRRAKQGTDEGTLYEAVKITSEGKAFRVTFEMPKAAAARMVVDMLDKRAARGATPNQD
jgi:hypothetical protein